MMMTTITPEELASNLGFLLDLVQRGHTFKIVQEGTRSVLLTSISNPVIPEMDPISLTGVPPSMDLVPDTEIRNFVQESLSEIQKEM
jgi:hypothetical protein